ncbi:hypothetical protein LEP1GSC071_2306 [Leptospira santarosai str. JET]|uniref:Uncharacterized protein n=1 Tax=Leptospira santarosai serovar Shermani str. LT 821 TaxID=758847 RepID=A0A097ES94_9LEPT|nr:hypothetical protein LSS_20785 [Leptospira santarosai serovar Shermani str. LT 821]EKS09840.1 hypothetical protein LEP1GSC071_2306 [Leptospira santarosai str. JET]EPG80872.1 hypothetical protein LEP1GSC048_2228 [Leptospira santarosai serovar Shermani str. 1342KT]
MSFLFARIFLRRTYSKGTSIKSISRLGIGRKTESIQKLDFKIGYLWIL